MLSINWPLALVLIVLLICLASVSETYIISKTTEKLSPQNVGVYAEILGNANKGLPQVNLNLGVNKEVTNETKTK